MVKKVGLTTGTYRIEISGLVQGVGFRPFIYRLARNHQLSGWVENRNDGVVIHANATTDTIEIFRKSLIHDAPRASDIEKIVVSKVQDENFSAFHIRKSEDVSDQVTEISPDIAVCPDCLEDMQDQAHRIDYPFVNCTNCGPRFSIIIKLPYDRPNTSMDNFIMCP